MNCSAQLYSTRSTIRVDDVYNSGRGLGRRCHNRTTSSLVYVSEVTKASKASSSGMKMGAYSARREQKGW